MLAFLNEFQEFERISIDQIEIISILERLLWYFFTGKEKVISIQSFRNNGIMRNLLTRGFPLFEKRVLDIFKRKCHWIFWQNKGEITIIPSMLTFVDENRKYLYLQQIEIQRKVDHFQSYRTYDKCDDLQPKEIHKLRESIGQAIPLLLNLFFSEIKGTKIIIHYLF
jgi:hypothetical protein